MELNLNGDIQKRMELYDPGHETGYSSCVIEGTTVLLRDGTEKAIEEISIFSQTEKGDTILNIHGSNVYPVAMISGTAENLPIVSLKVKTSQKMYQIKVSIWHAFTKNHFSLTPAFMLVKGDRILTSTGEGIITSIKYEVYEGKLWNVFLAGKTFKDILHNLSDEMLYSCLMNSLLGLQPKEHLIFFNGIPAASFMLQKQVIEKSSQGININQFI